MGSRSNINLAYIAGFLDGDGSLMLQIKKRKDGVAKKRFMCTICFYQDSRHEKPLYWIRESLGIGYVSRRNDGISELRINGYEQIRSIMQKLLPFLKFKKIQAMALYKATTLLSGRSLDRLKRNELLQLVDCILKIQDENYVKRKKKSKSQFMKILDLTP